MKESEAKSTKAPATSDSEMRSEYDFSEGVRGKYYNQYVKGAVIVLCPEVDAGGKKRPRRSISLTKG